MLHGRAQFLLCHAHRQVPGGLDPSSFASLRVGSDALVPVSAPDKSGRPRHQLSEAGKKRLPLLAYSAESGLGRIIRTLRGTVLDAARAEPVFTAHLATVLKTMALDGRGVAWLPLSLIQEDLREIRLVEAGPPDWRVEIDIRLFRNRKPEPAAAEAFWKAVANA
jgi:DNA-binding transcriptional LysR family regulator